MPTKTKAPKARKRGSDGPDGEKAPRVDHFERMTAEFVRLMEEGAADPKGWSMPWSKFGLDIPRNASTGKLYKRGNVVRLCTSSLITGHRAVWATFHQWLELGCVVEAGVGHHPTWIQFWAPRADKDKDKADADAEPAEAADDGEAPAPKRRAWINRTYKVFSVDQVVDLEPHPGARQAIIDRYLPEIEEDENLRFEAAEEVLSAAVEALGLKVRWGGDKAGYSPQLDVILMPERGQFTTRDGLYCTWAHEVIHSTGHRSRLPRPGITDADAPFGSEKYAFEELVAELGAVFMCQVLGVTPEPRLDNACYLNHWLKILREDARALSRAATQAQAAMEYALRLAGFDLVDEEIDDDAEEAEAEAA